MKRGAHLGRLDFPPGTRLLRRQSHQHGQGIVRGSDWDGSPVRLERIHHHAVGIDEAGAPLDNAVGARNGIKETRDRFPLDDRMRSVFGRSRSTAAE